jgi:Asp-tRNA(Asn)/Glu-tRNA(Gln) amidotransferase A subunit family amidase
MRRARLTYSARPQRRGRPPSEDYAVSDLTTLSARESAARIAAGSLTAEALVRACLDRIAERETVTGAWHYLDPDRAIAEARQRDGAAMRGALQGVPIGVKDVMDTHDMPTSYGSPIYRRHQPAADAACVALARAAGAVALGKTVTTEFATFHPGKTTNPHNPEHTPGGSSSGSAAAVADRMVPLAFGTQTAGSVIRPAAFCGIVGYKPSFGLISRSGVKPLSDSLDTVGVMARDVADAGFFAAVLSDRPELRLASPDLRVDGPAPRIALYRAPEWHRADAATVAMLEHVMERLRRAGCTATERAAISEHDGLVEAQQIVMDYETVRCLAFERLTRWTDLSQSLRERMEGGLAHSGATYDAARQSVARARQALPALFGDADALLVPAAPGEAPKGLDRTGDPLFNRAWTMLHVPCITVPAGHGPNGLPLGAQLVGRPGEDANLLRTASFLERALAG